MIRKIYILLILVPAMMILGAPGCSDADPWSDGYFRQGEDFVAGKDIVETSREKVIHETAEDLGPDELDESRLRSYEQLGAGKITDLGDYLEVVSNIKTNRLIRDQAQRMIYGLFIDSSAVSNRVFSPDSIITSIPLKKESSGLYRGELSFNSNTGPMKAELLLCRDSIDYGSRSFKPWKLYLSDIKEQ